MKHRLSITICWTALLCFMAGFLATVSWRDAVSTNVWDLLPQGTNPLEQTVRQIVQSKQGSVILASLAVPQEQREQSAELVVEHLRSLDKFKTVERLDQTDWLRTSGEHLWDLRFYSRMGRWLQDAVAESGSTDPQLLAALVVSRLNDFFEDPNSLMWEQTVESDPLLLFQQGLAPWLESGEYGSDNGNTVRFWIEQSASPFSEEGQIPVIQALDAIQGLLEESGVVAEWHYTGVSRFAAANRSAIQTEVKWLNISIIGAVMLIVLVGMRSLKILLPVALVTLGALLGGLAITLAVMGEIHILTFVLGSTLAGVAVDYALHLFVGGHSIRTVLRPLLIGCASTAIGFSVFLFSTLPLLQQTGLFVGSGLLIALVSALTLRLWIDPVACTAGPMVVIDANKSAEERRQLNLGSMALIGAGVAIIPVIVMGLLRIEWVDDLRELEYPIPHLRAEDAKVRADFGAETADTTFLVTGVNWLEVRNRWETLRQAVPVQQRINPNLSDWIPTEQQLNFLLGWLSENSANFAEALGEDLEQNGYNREAFAPFFNDWQQWTEQARTESDWDIPMLRLSDSLKGPLGLLFYAGDQTAPSAWMSLNLTATTDTTPIDISEMEGVVSLSQLEQLNELFAQYRLSAGKTAIAGALLLVLAMILMHGPRQALPAVSLPVGTVIVGFSLLGWLIGNLNLFHLVGGFLGACLALDYALFALQARTARLAFPVSIHFSAATTGTAFGILWFSNIHAVSSLGLTVLIIVTGAWLAAWVLWAFTMKRATNG